MLFIFGVLSQLILSDCALLLWSTEQVGFPALKVLQQEDFEEILNGLKQPNVLAFKANFEPVSTVLPRNLENLRSSYVPMTNLLLENSQDLGDDLTRNTELIKESLEPYKRNDNYENVLVAISFNTYRIKREDTEENITEPSTTVSEPPSIEDEGPAVYNGNGIVIIYSSQAPRLRINSTTLYLHSSKIVRKDNRDGYTRLITTVAVKGGKVILRFKFPVANGYWSLTSVEVVDNRNDENKSYNLTISSCHVGAPNRFSYHCHKNTVFKDATGNVELVLCFYFMTGPIWSGILVTASLIVGFFIALAALGDIKTMDKFDNYKTKQLNITVVE